MSWLLGMLLVLGLFWAINAHADITTGLVGWWKMDDGSGTQVNDSSPGTHHGTRTATTGDGPDWAAGQIGTGSLLFVRTNQDRVNVPHHADFNITGDLTIAAWVRRTGTGINEAVLLKTNGTTQWDWGLYITSTNRLWFYADTIQPEVEVSTVNIGAAAWTHIVATRTGTAVAYYTGNSATGTAVATSGSFFARTHPVLLGSSGAVAEYLNANLDDVRIYTRALSAPDVTELFNYTEVAAPAAGARRRIIISQLQGPRPWQRPGKYRPTSVLPWLDLLGLLGKETPTW